jgi:RES domain-containing protein
LKRGAYLRRALAKAGAISLEATAFRAIQTRFQDNPLGAIGSLRGRRFNPKGRQALYLCEDAIACLREVEFGLSSGGAFVAKPLDAYTIFAVNFSLHKVLDLTDPQILKLLNTTREELIAPWRPIQIRGKVAPTQSLGLFARALGYEALKAPSAVLEDKVNLVVFPINLKAGSYLELIHPTRRTKVRLEGAGMP